MAIKHEFQAKMNQILKQKCEIYRSSVEQIPG